jgi:hypothetical protein
LDEGRDSEDHVEKLVIVYRRHLIGVSGRHGAIMHVTMALKRTSGWINDGLVKF